MRKKVKGALQKEVRNQRPERSVKTGGVEGRIWIDGRGRTFTVEGKYIYSI